jgi:hypothetical protein
VSRPLPAAEWLAALHARADRPPLHPRVPLWNGDARIGSVEPGFFRQAAMPAGLVGETSWTAARSWRAWNVMNSRSKRRSCCRKRACSRHPTGNEPWV